MSKSEDTRALVDQTSRRDVQHMVALGCGGSYSSFELSVVIG